MEDQLIKVQEAVKELGVTKQTLYNWKNKGYLNFIKSPSGGIFIKIDEKYKKIKIFYGENKIINN